MLSSTTSGGPSAPAAAALLQLLLAAGADPLAASVRRRCSTLRCACGSEFLRSLPPLLDHLEGRLAAGGLALGTGDAAAEVLVGAARFCRLQLWRVAHEFVLAASGRRPTLAPAGGAVPHRGRRAIDSSSSSDDEGGAGEAEVSSGSRPANEASGGSGSSGGGCGGAGGASGDSLEGALEWLARAAPPRWQPTQQQLFEVLRSAALGGSVDIYPRHSEQVGWGGGWVGVVGGWVGGVRVCVVCVCVCGGGGAAGRRRRRRRRRGRPFMLPAALPVVDSAALCARACPSSLLLPPPQPPAL